MAISPRHEPMKAKNGVQDDQCCQGISDPGPVAILHQIRDKRPPELAGYEVATLPITQLVELGLFNSLNLRVRGSSPMCGGPVAASQFLRTGCRDATLQVTHIVVE